jgi:hypothetical protein
MLLALGASVLRCPGHPTALAQLPLVVALWAREIEAMPLAETAIAALRQAMRDPAPSSRAATAPRSCPFRSCHNSGRHSPPSASG